MANVIEEFVAFLGWEIDSDDLDKFQKDVEKTEKFVKGLAAGVTAAAAAIGLFTVVQNEQTARTVALAKAYGVNVNLLEALGNSVKSLGFDVENVGDLIEEMNNKIGESKGLGEPIGGVADSLKILGLEWKNIKELDPANQLIEILDAAIQLEDQQKAVSAVDILAGGEANRIIGFLRAQDESLRDIITRQFELNQLTDEGRKGAVTWTKAFEEITIIGKSLSAQLAGLIGEGLTPMLQQLTDWVIQNKELVRVELAKWAGHLVSALKDLFQVGKWVFERFLKLIDTFGGLENVLKIVAFMLATFITQRTLTMIRTAMVLTAGVLKNVTKIAALKKLKILWEYASLGILLLLLEDLYQYFTGGDSVTGRLAKAWNGVFEQLMDDLTVFVAGLLGLPVDEVRLMFVQMFEEPGTAMEKLFDAIDGKIEKLMGVDFAPWSKAQFRAMGAPFFLLVKFLGPIKVLIMGSIFGDTEARAKQWSKGLFSYFRSMGNSIKDIFKSVGRSVINTIATVMTAMGSMIDRLPAPVKKLLVGHSSGEDLAKEFRTKALAALEGPRQTAPGAPPLPYGPTSGPTIDPSAYIEPFYQTPAPSFVGQGRGPLTGPPDISVSNTNEINITQQPGQSGAELAKMVGDEIETRGAEAARNLASGVEY